MLRFGRFGAYHLFYGRREFSKEFLQFSLYCLVSIFVLYCLILFRRYLLIRFVRQKSIPNSKLQEEVLQKLETNLNLINSNFNTMFPTDIRMLFRAGSYDFSRDTLKKVMKGSLSKLYDFKIKKAYFLNFKPYESASVFLESRNLSLFRVTHLIIHLQIKNDEVLIENVEKITFPHIRC